MNSYRPPAALYPFRSNWLELGGPRMHYLDEGPREAPVVLMLHGNPTWSFYYRDLVVQLSDRFRCIVPDHVGCGLSDKPRDEHYRYRLERRIADLEALLAHIEPDRPLHLVVHDWGGMIGFAWAVQNPQRIASLVILNTAAFRMPPSKRFPFALWLAGRTRLGGYLVRRFNAFSGLAARIAFKRPVSDEVRQAYKGPYDSWDHRIATLRFVQDIPLREGDPGFDIVTKTEQRLPSLAGKPALIAWGERDFVFDQPFLQRWQEFFPGAECLAYPDCGHYILEDGGPELRRRIVAFLDEQAAARDD